MIEKAVSVATHKIIDRIQFHHNLKYMRKTCYITKNRSQIHQQSHTCENQLSSVTSQHVQYRCRKRQRYTKQNTAHKIIDQPKPVPRWKMPVYCKNNNNYNHQSKMIKGLFKYNCGWQNTDRKLHFCYNVNFLINSITSIGNTRTNKNPDDHTSQHP